jgi:hypothetical protein
MQIVKRSVTFLVLAFTFLSPALAADPYTWLIAHPDGRVTTHAGQSGEFSPLQPGVHTVQLTVQYAHEHPLHPGELYRTTTTEYLTVSGADLRSIFADDFEDGTTGAWSRTTGGTP